MNFFRKKNTAYISLEQHDLNSDAEKLWADLQYTLHGQNVEHVTIRLYDATDISLKALSIIVSLGLKLKHDEIRFEFEASRRVISLIRRLNFASSFAQLTEVA